MSVQLDKLAACLLLCLFGMTGCADISAGTDNLTVYYRVSRIIDGDTIVLSNGQRVRYLGIDCPELHRANQPPECGAAEATEENRKIIGSSRVRLETDITDKDAYGRLLRFVYTESGVFVNYEMVRRGWAQVFSLPPDVRRQAEIIEAQSLARQENLGLWKKCFNH